MLASEIHSHSVLPRTRVSLTLSIVLVHFVPTPLETSKVELTDASQEFPCRDLALMDEVRRPWRVRDARGSDSHSSGEHHSIQGAIAVLYLGCIVCRTTEAVLLAKVGCRAYSP